MLESVLRRNSTKHRNPHLFDKERRQTHNGFSQLEKLFRKQFWHILGENSNGTYW